MGSIGNAPYFRQPDRIVFDVLTGYTIEKRWSGRADNLLTDAFDPSGLGVGGQRVDYQAVGPKADVTVTFRNVDAAGNPGTPATTFDLRTETTNLSLFKHPSYSFLSPYVVKTILTELKGSTDYPASFNAIVDVASPGGGHYGTGTGGGTDPAAATAAIDAFNLLLSGDEYYLNAQSYVLSRTLTAEYGFTFVGIAGANADDGKLFSSSGLSTYLGSALPFTIPVLSAIPDAGSNSLLLAFGWLKRGGELVAIAGGRSQFTETWQAGRWSKLVYAISSYG